MTLHRRVLQKIRSHMERPYGEESVSMYVLKCKEKIRNKSLLGNKDDDDCHWWNDTDTVGSTRARTYLTHNYPGVWRRWWSQNNLIEVKRIRDSIIMKVNGQTCLSNKRFCLHFIIRSLRHCFEIVCAVNSQIWLHSPVAIRQWISQQVMLIQWSTAICLIIRVFLLWKRWRRVPKKKTRR